MKPNPYRMRWARWLPGALQALALNPPDYKAVMPDMPLPDRANTPFVMPPACLRTALVTPSGAYDMRSQAPFAASSIVGDPTHRLIEADIPRASIGFAHEHFNHGAALEDLEAVIPRDSLRGLGVELTAPIISWTGYLLDWPTFVESSIPQIVKSITSGCAKFSRTRADLTNVPQDGRSGRQRLRIRRHRYHRDRKHA